MGTLKFVLFNRRLFLLGYFEAASFAIIGLDVYSDMARLLQLAVLASNSAVSNNLKPSKWDNIFVDFLQKPTAENRKRTSRLRRCQLRRKLCCAVCAWTLRLYWVQLKGQECHEEIIRARRQRRDTRRMLKYKHDPSSLKRYANINTAKEAFRENAASNKRHPTTKPLIMQRIHLVKVTLEKIMQRKLLFSIKTR